MLVQYIANIHSTSLGAHKGSEMFLITTRLIFDRVAKLLKVKSTRYSIHVFCDEESLRADTSAVRPCKKVTCKISAVCGTKPCNGVLWRPEDID